MDTPKNLMEEDSIYTNFEGCVMNFSYFKIIIFNVFILNSCTSHRKSYTVCQKFNFEDKMDDLVKCLREDRPKNIFEDKIVQDYLKKHKVYVSLTSSPDRLRYIPTILKTLDLDLVSEIFLTLPKKFKDKEDYSDQLIDEIDRLEKVSLLRPDKDFGPITKLLPAIEFVRKRDPYSIVITIDDDTAYPIGIFSELVSFIVKNNVNVAAGFGQPSSFWNLHSKKVNFKNTCLVEEPCDVVEGFSAIAYVAGSIPTEIMKKYSMADTKCKLGDDIVINYSLAINSINRYRINPIFSEKLVQLYYGFASDALHKQNNYNHSYQECVQKMDKIQ
jgi:hypothetical protein